MEESGPPGPKMQLSPVPAPLWPLARGPLEKVPGPQVWPGRQLGLGRWPPGLQKDRRDSPRVAVIPCSRLPLFSPETQGKLTRHQG